MFDAFHVFVTSTDLITTAANQANHLLDPIARIAGMFRN